MLLFSSILLFFCILAMPIFFFYYPPKKINFFYGYRTKRSMKNEDSWNFANHHFPKILLKLSIFTAIVQVITYFIFGVIVSIFVTSVLWIVILFLTIYLTEKKLKEKD